MAQIIPLLGGETPQFPSWEGLGVGSLGVKSQ